MIVAALTAVLIIPASRVVHQWGRRLAASNPEGSPLRAVGEGIVILT